MNRNKPYNVLRWTARIYGTIVVALLLCLAISEYIGKVQWGASPSASLSMILNGMVQYWFIFLPWLIAGVGLILALWKEGLGGGISLTSFIISLFTLGFPRNLNAVIPIAIVSVPAILYLIYWWRMLQYNGKSSKG